MKILFIIILCNALYPRNGYRGCMHDDQTRTGLLRPDLTESYISPSEHFMIHYDAEGQRAPDQTDINPQNGIPDYVEEVGLVADLTRSVLIDSMGFKPEIDDSDGKYDIYIVDSNELYDAYGWNYIDGNDEIEGTSWVEIDNDYSEDVYYTNGLAAMRATVAHEFFHAIQRAYHEKSSGTYIEGGIQPVDYAYFYEFSSMWLEDVIVPESNDYLYFTSGTSASRFFSNPEQKLSDTDGYSIALFGHYLSHVVENIEDQNKSTLIRKVWQKFGDDLLDPVEAIDAVLLEDYNSSFIESWVDFCSRNFHNGQFPDMNNDIYYHEDQTSSVLDLLYNPDFNIQDINLHQGYSITNQSIDTLSLLEIQNDIQVDALDDFSIEMHSIVADSTALLTMDYSYFPLFGKYVISDTDLSESNNTNLLEDISTEPIVLNKGNTLHFVYGGVSLDAIDEEIDISVSLSYFPVTPDFLSASASRNGIELLWEPLLSDEELTYNVYRNDLLIADGLIDTSYIDANVNPITEYTYAISCSNAIGESELSNNISEVSWPSDNQVTVSKIISAYPNPISRPGISEFNMIVDYKSNVKDLKISIFDINGRVVSEGCFGERSQGRFEERLGDFLYSDLSSGIYFVHIDCDGLVVKQKITILK